MLFVAATFLLLASVAQQLGKWSSPEPRSINPKEVLEAGQSPGAEQGYCVGDKTTYSLTIDCVGSHVGSLAVPCLRCCGSACPHLGVAQEGGDGTNATGLWAGTRTIPV